MKNDITFYNSTTKKTKTLYNFNSVELYLNDLNNAWYYRVTCDGRFYYFEKSLWVITAIQIY